MSLILFATFFIGFFLALNPFSVSVSLSAQLKWARYRWILFLWLFFFHILKKKKSEENVFCLLSPFKNTFSNGYPWVWNLGFGIRIERGMGYFYILFYPFLLKVFMIIMYYLCNEKYFLCSKISLNCSEEKMILT